MDAVILVGGFGTRLQPLTYTVPKQMLPIAGATMLERVVAHLGSHGVTRAILALGYKPDVFIDEFPDQRCAGVELVYAVEPEPLDTGGAVRFAALAGGVSDTFVVVNGDVLTDLDVSELIAFHRSSGAEGTIALTKVDDPSRYGVVPIEQDGRVKAFIEKPPADEAPSHWINAGTYVLEPSVLDRIDDGRRVSIEREVFPAMVADSALYAMERQERWVDAGTPATYLEASLGYIDGTIANEPVIAEDAWVHNDAVVFESWIGPGAVVEAGAVIERSLVLAGARIGARAVLKEAIVGPAAVVGAGAKLLDLTVLGEGVEIPPGEELIEATVASVEDES